MEEKKKVFPWKKVVIIAVIILLVLAMTPLFWTDLIIEAQMDDIIGLMNKDDRDFMGKTTVVVMIKSEYWRNYEKERYTVKSFRDDNIERIEYVTKDEGWYSEWDGKKYGLIRLYLKETEPDDIRKTRVKVKKLPFVHGVLSSMD